MVLEELGKDIAMKSAESLPKALSAFWEAGKRFVNKHDLRQHSIIYLNQLLEQASTMQILGMENPVPLDTIFTEVHVVNRIESRRYKSIQELEQEARVAIETRSLKSIKETTTENLVLEIIAERNRDAATARRVLRKMRREVTKIDEGVLTKEENSKLLEQLPVRIEEELKKRVQKELTQKMSEDFGLGEAPKSSSLPAVDAIRKRNRAIILGKPGAGKTTFLKHLTLRHIRDKEAEPKLPIMITLREYATSNHRSILAFITEMFSDSGFSDPMLFLEKMLRNKHSCILLFDGLDEVQHKHQERIVREIVKLSKKYPGNQFLISCRTANYRGQLEGFSELEIAEFEMTQIIEFVKGWFSSNPDMAASFLSDLKRNPGLLELSTTPLLLALLCIGYRRNQCFPEQKALVYLACLDALLVDWDSSRQIRRDKLVERLGCESKKQLISKVACDTFCERLLFFSKSEILDHISAASQPLPIDESSNALVLREFVEHHGLLVERAQGIYSFSHLTIQEFLAAFHLSRNQPVEVLINLVREFWSDPRWREVVAFLGGIMGRADPLLICLRNHAKQEIADLGLSGFLYGSDLPESAEEFLNSRNTKGNREAWRIWIRWRIFEYYLRGVTYGTEFALFERAISDLNTNHYYYKALGLDKIANNNSPRKFMFEKTLWKVLEETHGFPQSQLNKTEFETLYNYIRTVTVLVEMISSGVRISPQLRDTVLSDITHRTRSQWSVEIAYGRNKLGA